MQTVAIIEKGLVVNVVMADESDDSGLQIAKGQTAVALPEASNVAIGDSYSNGKFIAADRSPAVIELSPEEVLARNKATYSGLLTMAGLAIDPLNDAVLLESATDDEKKLLLAWRQYRIELNRTDLTTDPVAWPIPPAAAK